MNYGNNSFERAMIVDDNSVDRYTTSYVMRKNSFAGEILEFSMGTEAIRYLEANQNHPGFFPEIIVLDLRRPAMDGFEFLERLSRLPQCAKQNCQVVVLSSSLDPGDRKRVEEYPVVTQFVNKPLHRADLEVISTVYMEALVGS